MCVQVQMNNACFLQNSMDTQAITEDKWDEYLSYCLPFVMLYG